VNSLTLAEVVARLQDILRTRPAADLFDTGIEEVRIKETSIVFLGAENNDAMEAMQRKIDSLECEVSDLEYDLIKAERKIEELTPDSK
jgi:hypothetical protein